MTAQIKPVKAWAVLNVRGYIDVFSISPQKKISSWRIGNRSGCTLINVLIIPIEPKKAKKP